MSIWEYQSQWCLIEIMTFPVKKGRKSCKLWLEMTQELFLHMKIFEQGETLGRGDDSSNRRAANEVRVTALLGHTQHIYC